LKNDLKEQVKIMFLQLPPLPEDWAEVLLPYLPSHYFDSIEKTLKKSNFTIFPEDKQIFRALHETPFSSTAVVILGQDPYHGLGEACGLAFGVKKGVKLPPSLKNLMKELKEDLGLELESPELVEWAHQGVLLLNRTLTVIENQPLSHKDLGWDVFLDAVMQALIINRKKVVFVALGKESEKLLKRYEPRFLGQKLLCFTHPSPLSAHRGFWGCKMFSKINQTLSELGLKSIEFGKAEI
jgi:uracil-DNA glycosylase